MKYTVYQITNIINDKIYIGCHKTKDIDDGYMGSGLALNRAYDKYGVEHFTKEILHIFDSSEEMFDKETELVNESFIVRKDTYNIKLGGNGGFDHINSRSPEQIAEHNRYIAKIRVIDPVQRAAAMMKLRATPGFIEKRDEGWLRHLEETGGSFNGKHHTAKSKAKIGAANSIHQKGKNNSQYGTCWIHNNIVAKKIEKSELEQYLIEGWIKGRKMSFK